MGIELLLPTTPKVGIEIVQHQILGTPGALGIRFFDVDATGSMDNVGDYHIYIEGGQAAKAQTTNAQFDLILKAQGINTPAAEYLKNTPRAQVLKDLRNFFVNLLKSIVEIANLWRTGKIVGADGNPYGSWEECVEDAVIHKTIYGINPDGSLRAEFP